MIIFKDVKYLIFSNTTFDLEIWYSVIEFPIYPGIGRTLLNKFFPPWRTNTVGTSMKQDNWLYLHTKVSK